MLSASKSGSGLATGYNLTRSLRFRASASATLSRTPSVAATSNKTFTVSFWMKPSLLVPLSYIWLLDCAGQDFGFYLNANYTASFQLSAGSYYITTSQVFRDPASWYHMVLSIDTTQATAANRVKLYVNGSQVTAFSSATYPPQNTTFAWNQNAQVQYFGRNSANASILYDGYLAEIYNIDGQALTPSSFGSTNALTGVWQPARYTGSYGTNGFYLPFTDNSAATAAAIGKDSSGNGNNWTPNNISVTAGVTYDSMTDVPTLTSATAANFAVLNPLDKNTNITVSGGNLNAISDATAAWRSGAMTFGNFTTGKWYYEVTANSIGASTYVSAGWELTTFNHTTQTGGVGASGSGNNFGVLINNALRQTKVNSTTFSSDANANSNGDVLIIAVDFDAGKGWVGKNGTWYDSGNPSAGTNPCTTTVSGGMTPAYQAYNAGSLSFNAGQRAFSYTAPTGFVALNTYNLPTSTIVKGNTVMDATLYTGTGASLSVTNTASFKPDLVWVKSRSAATDHRLTDSVRGVTKVLMSNTTGTEATDTQGLTAFNSNGFTVGTNTTYNNLSATYVGWQWQAGQGTSSSNTNGTITSTVSVNASAGFSIATYTGTGANATVGHGLGVAPQFIIVKNKTTAYNWWIYHTSIGNTNYLILNTTDISQSAATGWNSTTPTSSVFSVGTAVNTNASSASMLAYCWTPIAGYSAFGSYTGNGSADGPFVYTGFKPKFVFIKSTTSAYDWIMIDGARNLYNLAGSRLIANASDAEVSDNGLDILSNGFKLRSSNGSTNVSSGTMIYAAFAENPFKNSLAR